MLATCGGGVCRFVDDAGFSEIHIFFLEGVHPRVICVNAVDKGVTKQFVVKAVDKGLSCERRKSKCDRRNSMGWTRKSKVETRKSKFAVRGALEIEGESVPVKKGKELGCVVGAGRVARYDFTGYDRAIYLDCTVPI